VKRRCQIAKERLEQVKKYTTQIVRLQAVVRGTLARWNLPCVRLERKLDAIRKLKDKQLKKLAQRTEQKKQSLRIEMEHHFEHRVLLRRNHKAEFLKTHFEKLRTHEQQLHDALAAQCQELNQQTVQLRQSMFQCIRETGMLRMEVATKGRMQSDLQRQCNAFQCAIQVFQDVLDNNNNNGESR
jgi:hypothetical protein